MSNFLIDDHLRPLRTSNFIILLRYQWSLGFGYKEYSIVKSRAESQDICSFFQKFLCKVGVKEESF